MASLIPEGQKLKVTDFNSQMKQRDLQGGLNGLVTGMKQCVRRQQSSPVPAVFIMHSREQPKRSTKKE